MSQRHCYKEVRNVVATLGLAGIVWVTTMGTISAESDALDYWPTQQWTMWTYKDSEGGQTADCVVAHHVLDGEPVIVIERTQHGGGTARTYYAIRDGQVWHIAEAGVHTHGAMEQFASPVLVWPAQATVGTRWRMTNATPTTEMVILRQGRITVPAGTFEALVVVSTSPSGRITTQWVARNVGTVRTEITWPKTGRHWSKELIRFLPPEAATKHAASHP